MSQVLSRDTGPPFFAELFHKEQARFGFNLNCASPRPEGLKLLFFKLCSKAANEGELPGKSHAFSVICRVLVGIRLDTQLLDDRVHNLLPGTKVPFRSPYGPLSKQELKRLNLSEQKNVHQPWAAVAWIQFCLSRYSVPVVIIVGFNQTKKTVMNKAVGHDFPLRGHRARSIVMHT